MVEEERGFRIHRRDPRRLVVRELKVEDLKSKNNSKPIVQPRQVAMYLCKQLTQCSLPEIGKSFGGKHHSTVIHSIRKVEALRKKDSDFNSLMSNFLEGFR